MTEPRIRNTDDKTLKQMQKNEIKVARKFAAMTGLRLAGIYFKGAMK